jgi:hypothetical protein
MDLIEYEAVRKDLGLTAEEQDAIAAARAKADRTAAELEQKANGQLSGKEMSAVQRAQLQQEVVNGYQQKRIQIGQEYNAELSKILKPAHFKRLEQIDWQRNWHRPRPTRSTGQAKTLFAGPADGIPNELGLTADQLAKRQAIQSEFRRKTDELNGFRLVGKGREEIAKHLEQRRVLRREEETKLLEVLTPEQRQKLQELQGAPFDISIFDPLAVPLPPAAIERDPLEAKFDQSVIDYVNGTLLKEQDANGDGSLDKSEWVKGKWSAANPPENSDLNKDGKLSREELCIRISKNRGIPIKGEKPQPVPDSSK